MVSENPAVPLEQEDEECCVGDSRRRGDLSGGPSEGNESGHERGRSGGTKQRDEARGEKDRTTGGIEEAEEKEGTQPPHPFVSTGAEHRPAPATSGEESCCLH